MTNKITVSVTLDVAGDAEEMAKLFAEYLTVCDSTLSVDYGPRSYEDTGWEGPYVFEVTVHDSSWQRLAAADFTDFEFEMEHEREKLPEELKRFWKKNTEEEEEA